jgi:hypothetical protein
MKGPVKRRLAAIAVAAILVAALPAGACGESSTAHYATFAADRCITRSITLGFDDAKGKRRFVTLSNADAEKLYRDLTALYSEEKWGK